MQGWFVTKPKLRLTRTNQDGGIGRRAGLRNRFNIEWGFDSSFWYMFKRDLIDILGVGLLFVLFLCLSMLIGIWFYIPPEVLAVVFAFLIEQYPVSMALSFLGNLMIFSYVVSVYALDYADAKQTEEEWLRRRNPNYFKVKSEHRQEMFRELAEETAMLLGAVLGWVFVDAIF